MLLKLGLIPAYTLLIFVSAFFTVFRAKLCIYGRKYLELVLKRKVGVFSLSLYKLNFTFGMSMIDRVAYFADSKKIRIEDNAESVIKSVLSKGKGVLILTSHVGGWQISSGELLKYGVPVGLVGAQLEDEKIARLFDSQIKRSSPIYIGSMGDASGFLTAYSQLKGGGIVAMHADRYVGGRFETIEFFGKKVRVPSACYKLAKTSAAGQAAATASAAHCRWQRPVRFHAPNPAWTPADRNRSSGQRNWSCARCHCSYRCAV